MKIIHVEKLPRPKIQILNSTIIPLDDNNNGNHLIILQGSCAMNLFSEASEFQGNYNYPGYLISGALQPPKPPDFQRHSNHSCLLTARHTSTSWVTLLPRILRSPDFQGQSNHSGHLTSRDTPNTQVTWLPGTLQPHMSPN